MSQGSDASVAAAMNGMGVLAEPMRTDSELARAAAELDAEIAADANGVAANGVDANGHPDATGDACRVMAHRVVMTTRKKSKRKRRLKRKRTWTH